MSDSDDELFGGDSGSDGGDTDELIAAAKKADAKPIAKKKATSSGNGGRLKKKKIGKKKIPDADGNSDDEGLFDSDDEGAKKKKAAPVKKKKALSKREKMEALRAKKRAAMGTEPSESRRSRSKEGSDDGKEGSKAGEGGDAYDSGEEYVRTKADDDFIDVEGEDEDVVREYYAEQKFDDERPDDFDDDEDMERRGKKGSKSSSSKRGRGPDSLSAADKADQDNPIMQAVNRMKRKKKVVKSYEEVKDTAQEFVSKMENAADHDDVAIQEKRPGLKRLQMLPEVLDMMTNTELMRPLLEADILIVIKRWIQPLSNGSLGNVTVRSKLLKAISKMTGENGIDTDDLKRSEFGKLVMVLYKHKKETPEVKKLLKALIEQWSRQIFKKSGDMRDLQSAQSIRRRDGGGGLTAISRAYADAGAEEEAMASRAKKSRRDYGDDIGDAIVNSRKQARDMGKNRVRIPYSKGFQFTIRPENVTGDVTDKKTRISTVKDSRGSLHKRMLDKKRPVSKNNRSANISIEGRPTK